MSFRGRSAAEMAEARAAREPFPRVYDGRLDRQIRFAFHVAGAPASLRPKDAPAEITTRYLMSFCYPWEYHCGQLKTWHRTNTIKAARKVAIPRRRAGKGVGKGYGFVWEAIPEALAERSWVGKANRKRKRQGLPPLEL